MELDWCKACDKGLPAPDCIIYLDIDVEQAAKVVVVSRKDSLLHYYLRFFIIFLQRGNFGEERYEKVSFQKKVREQFMTLKDEDVAKNTLPWYVLDATKSVEDLHNEIVAIADRVMVGVADKPISRLWTN